MERAHFQSTISNAIMKNTAKIWMSQHRLQWISFAKIVKQKVRSSKCNVENEIEY